MTEKEKEKYWWYKTTGGYLRTRPYKEAWRHAFDKASPSEVLEVTKLPNFSYKIFKK